MPDSFNGLNYACRIVTCQAFIFKQEGGGLTIVPDSKTNTSGKNIDFPRLNFSLCLLADDTKIALHLRDNQGKSSTCAAVVLTRTWPVAGCVSLVMISCPLLAAAINNSCVKGCVQIAGSRSQRLYQFQIKPTCLTD